jgi:hypothetical protein
MQVLAPNSAQARQDIEIMSDEFYPFIIRFVEDGSGQLFITYTVANDPRFATIKVFILANTHEVTYVPPVMED